MKLAFAPSTNLGARPFAPCVTLNCTASSPLHASRVYTAPILRSAPSMVSETNIAKKAAKVKTVQDTLADSMLLFAVPLKGLTVANVATLKEKMPEGTKIITVKNTLMRRAVADGPWQSATDLTNESSIWVFVKEDLKQSVKGYKEFIKELNRDAPIRGGVFEGEKYDTAGIEAVSALPSKKELITKIAISIKAVPTKIARSVKAVPTKVGRAVKLAFAEEEGGEPSDSGGDSSSKE